MSKVISVFFILFIISCTKKPFPMNSIPHFQGKTMGTTFNIKVAFPFSDKEKQTLFNDITNLLVEINQQMSTYLPDSEISLFNKLEKNQWFPIPEEFYEVLAKSMHYYEYSQGAFDPTIGPLVNAWGFGPVKKSEYKPLSEEQIALIKSQTGFFRLKINKKKRLISKEISSLYLDFSAIAKGYGVEKVSALLKDKGYMNHMVEIGGEVKSMGTKPNGNPWRIGIEAPDGSKTIQKIVNLSNTAMATSGDYRNFFEYEGVKYTHAINPLDGKPVKHNIASVTVLHENCTDADALATAFLVMGLEKSMKLALKNGLAVLFILRTDSGFTIKETPSFREALFEKK